MPSKDSNYLEKCRCLFPEIDKCLKQYNYYVEDRKIDTRLLEISSNHILFKDVKSILKNKYVYSNGKYFDYVAWCLFSNQCMLSYTKKTKDKYNSFYKLVIDENIMQTDIEDYEQGHLIELLKGEYIYIDESGYIKFKNEIQILILKDIYENDVISYWKLEKEYRENINILVNAQILKFENSLFSIPEQNYLNYNMNKSEFSNSLDLRNKNSHGTQPYGDEKIHYKNYIRILKLFVLIILKINDELCINYEKCE